MNAFGTLRGLAHKRTVQLLAAVVVIALAVYAASLHWPRAHDAWQVGFGIAASAVMLTVIAYGVRRRLPGRPIGTAATWLKGHMVGGVVFLLLVFMHCGFEVPSGTLNLALWVLSIWMTVTGLLGLWIQRWIPHAMASGLANEVHFDRIPELVGGLAARADQFVATCSEPIQTFYRSSLAPMFAEPRPSLVYYADVTGGRFARRRQFEYLSHALGSEERAKLDRLEAMFHAKLELDAHLSLQRALRWWLVAHVPFTIVLLCLVVVHVWFALRY